MTDLSGRPTKKARAKVPGLELFEFVVTNESADHPVFQRVSVERREVRQRVDVDEHRRLREEHVHRWHKALSTSEYLRVLVDGECVKRLIQGGGAFVVKRCRLHRDGGSLRVAPAIMRRRFHRGMPPP